MFSFSKDALDLIGQGTVKKSKMTAETTETVAPQTNFEDAEKLFAEASANAQSDFKDGISVEGVAPSADDDIFFVPGSLALPLATKYAVKANARVLIVETSEARVHAAVASLKAVDKDIDVTTALPFAFAGPKKVTVTSAIVLAGLLARRKNLNPFTHVLVANVTSLTIGMQVLIGQLRRIVNTPGAKGHHRILLCGDVKIGLDIIKPIFNKLNVSGLVTDATNEGTFINIDQVAAFSKKQLVKIPLANAKAPFAPYVAFAADQAKEIVGWAHKSLPKTEGAVVVIGQEGLDLKGCVLPIVAAADAAATKGLFVVVASTAEEIVAAGIKPVVLIDLGVATIRGANSPSESLLQDPRTEFASTVEISQRRALAGNHPYFALYPANVPRPLRTFDAVLTKADRNELLQATRGGLDFRVFLAPIRETALDEALTSFAELGLIQSKTEPVQTFLGEIVSRLSCVSSEMGTFVAIAASLGLGDVAAAIAAANTASFYKDAAQKARLRSEYDPDDSNSSDLLADGIVFLTESEHAGLDATKLAAATAIQADVLRTLTNYLPPSDKRSAAELRAALTKSAALLAYLIVAIFSTSACKINNSVGEFLNIRSIDRVKAPAEGSVVSFPTSGAMAVAANLTKESATSIIYDGVTIVCNGHFNAAQVLLRPVVFHSSAADTTKDGENIVRFAVSSNGLSSNYHVPVEYANKIIEARAALCTALGLLMLRRLLTPHATSTESFVEAIRRKRRDFNFRQHMEETARRLEVAVQESPAAYVITTFVKKQASVLAPNEVGQVEEGSPAAIATDAQSLATFFDKVVANKKKEGEEDKKADEKAEADEKSVAEEPVTPIIDDDDDEDFFSKNGPIMDDDDE